MGAECKLQSQGWLGEFRLLLSFTLAVELIAESAAVVAVNTHGAVPVEAVIRAPGSIDGDLMMVDAEPVALGAA